MGKAGGTGGPCGSLVLLGDVEASRSCCPLHSFLRVRAPWQLLQASIPLDLHHGAEAWAPSPGAEQLGVIRQGKAKQGSPLPGAVGAGHGAQMAQRQQCHGTLLPSTAATAHTFPQGASECIGRHPLLSPHAIWSPLPAVCLCLLFKPSSWWRQGFGGVGFDGLLQWGVRQEHGESLCAGSGHCSVQLEQLLECRLQTSGAGRELSLKGFQRRSVQAKECCSSCISLSPLWDWCTS